MLIKIRLYHDTKYITSSENWTSCILDIQEKMVTVMFRLFSKDIVQPIDNIFGINTKYQTVVFLFFLEYREYKMFIFGICFVFPEVVCLPWFRITIHFKNYTKAKFLRLNTNLPNPMP